MLKYLILILILGVVVFWPSKYINQEGEEYLFANIASHNLSLALADNELEQYKGLSNKKLLCDNCGMLFIFDHLKIRHFVMRQMLFPIDIVWLKDNRIIGYNENAQIENPPYTLYTSPEPVNAVVELPAGYIKENKILINDILDYGKQ